MVATLDTLGLELSLDHVERACRYAGDEAASRASFGSRAESDESMANFLRFDKCVTRPLGAGRTYQSCCLCSKTWARALHLRGGARNEWGKQTLQDRFVNVCGEKDECGARASSFSAQHPADDSVSGRQLRSLSSCVISCSSTRAAHGHVLVFCLCLVLSAARYYRHVYDAYIIHHRPPAHLLVKMSVLSMLRAQLLCFVWFI